MLIIGEGDSENAYFKELKSQHNLKFHIKPELPSSSDYKSIFKKAKENIDVYECVFCLIDLDHILNSDNCEQNYEKYKTEKTKLREKFPSIFIFESCPCFEIWLFFHFDDKSQPVETYCKILVEKKLKKYLPDYDFNKKAESIKSAYSELQKRQAFAIQKSEEYRKIRKIKIDNGDYNESNCPISFTEIDLIFQKLLKDK
ncbi:MAG: RloB family protein [Methanimicrococcus sp.]|nr:RloB family protein [Methanimicrococcus sp.]